MKYISHSHITTRLSAVALALVPFFVVQADELIPATLTPSQSDFGGVGLMQMPTGRMAAEGEFSLGTTYNDQYQHYATSIQLFPWFEATARYTQVRDLLYSNDPSFSGDTKYTDKGIDFKVRLWEESYWLPETSIGIRDFGGTGLFDGEFIAATKRFGPVDFTLGIAWGYMGNSGNLTSDKKDAAIDCGRDQSFGGKGGTVDYDRWFKGCAAVFGGIEYQTPWDPLRVKVEYDANDYQTDFPVVRGGIDMSQDSKFNYGLLYKVSNWGDFHLSYERGNTWTLGFTLNTNFTSLNQIKRDTLAAKYKPLPAAPLIAQASTPASVTSTPAEPAESVSTNIPTVGIFVSQPDSQDNPPNNALVIGQNNEQVANYNASSADTPESVAQRAISSSESTSSWRNDTDWDQLARELNTIAGYKNARIYLDAHSITVTGEQTRYRNLADAHHRAATLLANHSDSREITEYRIIETRYNQPITETRIDTATFAQIADFGYVNAKMSDSTTLMSPSQPQGTLVSPSITDWTDNVDWYISPTMAQSIGGSENFYMFNIGITGNASYQFNDNLELSGSLYVNLLDNYDKFLYDIPPDGTDLKRVRTLVRQYVQDETVRPTNVQLTWMDKLSDDIYYQAYGGYLELMFGGVGTEFMYRPMNSEWAFGVDVNYVKQRDPNSMFGFYSDENQVDAETGHTYRVQTGVVTGHATAYYQPNWFPNTLLKISAGQYLTEDKGVTVDFSKQFDSGVIVGAYVAKTNLSAEEYGEGSYTKGFYVSIPFDVMTIKPSRGRTFLSWEPLTRDGGQMLGRKYNLFDITDARSPWFTRPLAQDRESTVKEK